LIEHTLYNAVLPGLSLDGQQYFYQNPLENDGTHRRQPWFGCACCPPNVARLLAQLPGYFYSTTDSGDIYVHLYAAGDVSLTLPNGKEIPLSVETDYPNDGEIEITIGTAGFYALYLRVPDWAKGATLACNDAPISAPIAGEYAEVRRHWREGDRITLTLPMNPRFVRCHPYVAENTGRVAIFYGPLLYCAEKTDNPGIPNLHDINVSGPDDFIATTLESLPNILALQGPVLLMPPTQDTLYGNTFYSPSHESHSLTLIPYYAWANREPGQMLVWLLEES
jgi:DUF1680 family protein